MAAALPLTIGTAGRLLHRVAGPPADGRQRLNVAGNIKPDMLLSKALYKVLPEYRVYVKSRESMPADNWPTNCEILDETNAELFLRLN